MDTQLEACRKDLDKFIEEYQNDKSDFWLHPIREAINSIEFLKAQEDNGKAH